MRKSKLPRGLNLLGSLVLAAGLLVPSASAQSASPRSADATNSSNTGSTDPSLVQRPLTREERLRWFVDATVGPKSLGAGVISAGWGTAFNNPEEYGPHWDGFAKRYGMRLTGIATSNAIEAGLGSAWGEDPRYAAVGEGNVWNRVGHAAKMTVYSGREDGTVGLAYARYAGITGSNFLSNTWRVESESTAGSAIKRTGFGFAGKFVSNVFEEFWPDLRRKVFGRK